MITMVLSVLRIYTLRDTPRVRGNVELEYPGRRWTLEDILPHKHSSALRLSIISIAVPSTAPNLIVLGIVHIHSKRECELQDHREIK